MTSRASRCVLVFLATMLASPQASAVSCSIGVPALNFGNYDVFSSSALQSATTLTLGCAKVPGDPSGSLTVSFTIAISTGSSATYAQRTLANGANALRYNLYTDSARTLVWGDGSGGSQLVSDNLGLSNGNPQRTRNYTVYGRIPALQDVAVGSYADTLLVTVNY
jgi:spore coat protein U-like protein